MQNKNRPISPHLQIYKPQITSILSIAHRFTGIILYSSSFLFTIFLFSLAFNEDLKNILISFFSSFYGKSILFFITLFFIYHFLNGIRHLFWDIGLGFELPTLRLSGKIVVIFSILMTLGTYVACFLSVGSTYILLGST